MTLATLRAWGEVMFRPDLKLLRAFAAVADAHSVTRAAEALHSTQPTVSGQLKELETQLGFALFDRTTRTVALTQRGSDLLPLVKDILARADLLRNEVHRIQNTDRAHFRLGAAMYTLDLQDRVELLDAFGQTEEKTRYTIDNRLQSAQIPDLCAGRLDAAFILGVAVPPEVFSAEQDAARGDEIVNEIQFPGTLGHVAIARRSIGLLVPEESQLARYSVIPRSALAGRAIAMLSAEHGAAFVEPIAAFFRKAGATLLTPAEGNALAVERYAARCRIPALNLGWFEPPVSEAGAMIARQIEGFDFHTSLYVVLGRSHSRAAQRFFDFAADWATATAKRVGTRPLPSHAGVAGRGADRRGRDDGASSFELPMNAGEVSTRRKVARSPTP